VNPLYAYRTSLKVIYGHGEVSRVTIFIMEEVYLVTNLGWRMSTWPST